MKRSIVLLVLMVSMSSVSVHAQNKEFGWLIGKWKMKDKNVFETWSLDADGKSLKGVSMKIKGSEATILEETKLIFSGNSFYYIPDVAGDQDPVDFHITSYDDKSFVAENPTHDFPKLIRYTFRKSGDQEFLDAAIEGDGKVIPYSFEKVR